MRPTIPFLVLCMAVPAVGLADIPRPEPKPEARLIPAATASPRPEIRPAALDVVPQGRPEAAMDAGEAGFARWRAAFRGRALAAGVPAATLEATLPGLRYRSGIIARDRNQAEFTRAIWDYLDSAVSPARVENGRRMMAAHRDLLGRIQSRYGVPAQTVVAIWGLESAYGQVRGDTPTLSALATLAHDGRRGAFFEGELIAALKIVAAGDVSASGMVGSWAGAMGHTQFMPSSYLDYAVDFTGDGRRDIWGQDPADALASTAAYLDRHGWRSGAPWGVEVRLPEGFDYALADGAARSVAVWHRAGVRGTDGGRVADHGAAKLLLPAGARGPAFLTFANFDVIKRYNTSTAYSLAVGHLSERIAGDPGFVADWPRGDRALAFAEREELQRRLTARGFDTKGIDGRIGPDTRAAIRRYQQAAGLVPDGYASAALLARLR